MPDPQATGANGQIIFQEETVFGATPGSPDATILPFLSEGLGAKRTLNKSNIIRANRNPVKAKRGRIDVGGPINTELSPYMGTQLKHMIGTAASALTASGGGYTHTMKVGALPVGLTIEKGFTDLATPQYFLINGCRTNKVSFEFKDEGVVPVGFEYLGASRSIEASSFDSTPNDLGHDAFDGAEMSIEEGGSSIAYVQNVKMDVENDLDAGNYVIGGGGVRRSIPEGATLVSGSVTALFETAALLTKAINYTESSLKIALTRGTGVGTADNEYCEFLIPELIFEENDPLMSGPKGVLIELPFAAFYLNSAQASALQIILKNTQATI